jgi:Domain of unknown function (DUF932)
MSFMQSYGQMGASVLSDEQIMRAAPSAFATTAHDSRSDRFAVIPTGSIIAGMRRAGFQPVSAKQAVARDASRRDFTKHMIRFRHESVPTSTTGMRVGATFPEVVLVNANDGSSAYKLMAGVFRLVCLNGMIVSDRTDGGISVKHSGNVERAVIDGSYEVLDNSRKALAAADNWAGIDLNRDEQMAFAEAAHTIRFADADGAVTTPIRAEQLLQPRRHADASPDLWTTFNRIQENTVRGGLSGIARDGNGRRIRRVSTREVQGIDGDVRLNRALWALGERMASLKGA